MTIPLAGDFYLTGKTILQVKNEIIERLKEQILIPEVSIILVEPRPVSVFVLGEINNPGLYNLVSGSESRPAGMNIGYSGLPNLVSAIKAAGGITQDTNLKEV